MRSLLLPAAFCTMTLLSLGAAAQTMQHATAPVSATPPPMPPHQMTVPIAPANTGMDHTPPPPPPMNHDPAPANTGMNHDPAPANTGGGGMNHDPNAGSAGGMGGMGGHGGGMGGMGGHGGMATVDAAPPVDPIVVAAADPNEQARIRKEYLLRTNAQIRSVVLVNNKQVSPQEQAVIRDHWHDSMFLLRIREVAAADGNASAVSRCDDALDKKDKQFYAKLKTLNAQAP